MSARKARALVQHSALEEEQEQHTESSAAVEDKSSVEHTHTCSFELKWMRGSGVQGPLRKRRRAMSLML